MILCETWLLCDPSAGPSGELSSQLPEKLSLVIGSILGALAFLLLAAITVLAVIFQR
jgi:ephrin-B